MKQLPLKTIKTYGISCQWGIGPSSIQFGIPILLSSRIIGPTSWTGCVFSSAPGQDGTRRVELLPYYDTETHWDHGTHTGHHDGVYQYVDPFAQVFLGLEGLDQLSPVAIWKYRGEEHQRSDGDKSWNNVGELLTCGMDMSNWQLTCRVAARIFGAQMERERYIYIIIHIYIFIYIHQRKFRSQTSNKMGRVREEQKRREKIREEKESEESRRRCGKREKSRDSLCFSNDLWLWRVEK